MKHFKYPFEIKGIEIKCNEENSNAYLNGNSMLVVGSRREDLRFLRRNYSIPWNKLSHYTTNSFNTQSQWVYIEQHDGIGVLFTREYTSLYSRTIGDSFIRVDTSAWFFAIEEFFD